MRTEALKLADELDALHQYVPSEAPAMIRRLVAENEFLKDWIDTWSPFIKQQCVANNDMTQECVAEMEK